MSECCNRIITASEAKRIAESYVMRMEALHEELVVNTIHVGYSNCVWRVEVETVNEIGKTIAIVKIWSVLVDACNGEVAGSRIEDKQIIRY